MTKSKKRDEPIGAADGPNGAGRPGLKERDEPRKPLVRKVRKAVKKSRRKMSEEKFEQELERTISFLEEMRAKIAARSRS